MKSLFRFRFLPILAGLAALAYAQVVTTSSGGGGGGTGASNVSATCAGPGTTCAVTITSLNLSNLTKAVVQCKDANGAVLAISGTATSGGPPLTTATPTFSSTSNVTCTVNSNGGAGPAGSNGNAGATGPSGPSGASVTGATGPSGPSGASVTGPSGPSGPSGASGGGGLLASTVASLPAASGKTNQVYSVSDGSFSGDCLVGGGSIKGACLSDGTRWLPVSDYYSSTVTAERFGAAGNDSADDTTAIQAAITAQAAAGGGTVKLRAATYRISALTMPSNVSLVGEGPRTTILNSTSTTADVLSISGTGDGNCAAGGTMFSTIRDLGVHRVTPASAGKGLSITNGCWVRVQNVESWDSIVNFYITGSAATVFQDTQAYWTTSSGTTRYGYESDTNTINNASLRLVHSIVAAQLTTAVIGLYHHGGCIADLFVNDFETATADKGIVITSTTNPGTYSMCNGDLRLNHLVIDTALTKGIEINNVYGGGTPNIYLGDVYVEAQNASVIGIDLENTRGVTVSGTQIRSQFGSGVGIKIAGASGGNNNILGCTVSMTATGILLSSTSDNTISACTFAGIATVAATTHISLVSATNNLITGNVLSGYATTGISLDGSSSGNKVFPNTIDTTNITTAVSNSGANNVFDSQPTFVTQTDATTITWALANSWVANGSVTLGGNRTLNITNPVSGGSYALKVIQDGTGSRTLALGTGCTWKVAGGGSGAVTLTATASAVDVLAFLYDGANCLVSLTKNFN